MPSLVAHTAALPKTSTRADDPASVIDTSKMSAEQRAALELTESARTEAGKRNSLAGSFFMGSPDFRRIIPFPQQTSEDRARGDAFLAQLRQLLTTSVDPDAIDREGEIPEEVLGKLAALGAFGIKIPVRYGGLGLSQTNYSRAAMCLGGFCGNLTGLLSAHQSIGVPQPLIMFGTEEQRERYLPRMAQGEISAFALTEPEVGSDPAKMRTVARPIDGGEWFEISGEKLWCTNGTKAGLLVVMAKVLDRPEDASKPESARTITAFIVEADAPGVTVVKRCHFMGLRALYNGVMRFDKVRVPRENIILGEGRGLKVALSTLNTGRLTLPAACAGMARECLRIAINWAGERVQWGSPVGRHDAIAQKLAKMAADTSVIEAMVLYTSSLVDRDKKADIRIEAAMAKLWGTERAWEIVNETMQIRGGRGYETADSLAARGEEPVPVERFLRDCRINTIFEGSSEIMRLFIAREALDPHLRMGGPVLNSTLPWRTRLQALIRSGMFYSLWYPRLWLPDLSPLPRTLHPSLHRDLRRVRALSRVLARNLFHAMLRYAPKLEKKQALLGRFVDIGAELFAMTTLIARTQQRINDGSDGELALSQYFCRTSRQGIENLLANTRRSGNADNEGYRIAKSILSRH
jgi:alkylation response protein AidB-like acyl-CoA dehydrogenase